MKKRCVRGRQQSGFFPQAIKKKKPRFRVEIDEYPFPKSRKTLSVKDVYRGNGVTNTARTVRDFIFNDTYVSMTLHLMENNALTVLVIPHHYCRNEN